jgi:hypothetical protein
VIVHILEFRAKPGHEAELVGFLRSFETEARPAGRLLKHYIGRRLSRHQQEHIAVTCWNDVAAFARGTDPLGTPAYLWPRGDLLSDRKSSCYRVCAALGDGTEVARVLRVYRADVAASDVGEWERRTAEHMTDLGGTEGLVYLREGVSMAGANQEGSVPILALSCWRNWDAVLAATGGHIDRLVQATELIDLERTTSVDHFELVSPE